MSAIGILHKSLLFIYYIGKKEPLFLIIGLGYFLSKSTINGAIDFA
jgi:hypothetical protein